MKCMNLLSSLAILFVSIATTHAVEPAAGGDGPSNQSTCGQQNFDEIISKLEASASANPSAEVKTEIYDGVKIFKNPSGGTHVCIGYEGMVRLEAEVDAEQKCMDSGNTRCEKISTRWADYPDYYGCKAVSQYQGYKGIEPASDNCLKAAALYVSDPKSIEKALSACKSDKNTTSLPQAAEFAFYAHYGLADSKEYYRQRAGLDGNKNHQEALLLAVKKKKSLCAGAAVNLNQ